MILHWSQLKPDLTLQWVGPNKITAIPVTSMEQVASKLAVIVGPQGKAGDIGLPGPKGEKGDSATIDPDLPLILDGGFF